MSSDFALELRTDRRRGLPDIKIDLSFNGFFNGNFR